jgi:polyhydroxyalkanoate synthase
MTLLRDFFLEDKLSKPGGLKLNGVHIDIYRIPTPTYTVATIDDHIVPWRGAFQMRHRIAAPMRLILGESGHIAGVINHPAKKKRGYWINEEMDNQDKAGFDPDVWYAGATHHAGSWWVDWIPWLAAYSDKQIAPPSMGSDDYPPIMDAPGEYVLEA